MAQIPSTKTDNVYHQPDAIGDNNITPETDMHACSYLENVDPVHYKIFLKPDLENFTFSGELTVTFNIRNVVNVIACHAAKICVANIQIDNQCIRSSSLCSKNEMLMMTLHEGEQLSSDELHILTCDFSGNLDDNLRGIYRSTYKHEGKTCHGVVTQFEPADARRCFPW